MQGYVKQPAKEEDGCYKTI